MDAVKVTGAAVVLPTVDGREAYHYKGAVLPADGFTERGLEHALELGLIEEVDLEVVEDVEATVMYDQGQVDDLVEAAVDAKIAEIEQARVDAEKVKSEADKKTAAAKAAASKQS